MCFCLLGIAVPSCFGQQLLEPLPLDVVVKAHQEDSRSSFEFSPDGHWVAFTWMTDDTVLESMSFNPTGVPAAEGNGRTQASLVNIDTGEEITLGDSKSSNWAPVWSPDGKRVAFYSDAGGEAGVWIWDKTTGKTERFPGVIARPFFGFEIVRWSSDSHRILCKIVPEGLTLEKANELIPKNIAGRRFPPVAPGEPSVIVQKAGGKDSAALKPAQPNESEFTNRDLADLAILDLSSRSVTRIASRVKVLWFEFSPDEKYVGYSQISGFEANTQQPTYEISAYEIDSRTTRRIASNIRLGYGIELNWSPDSTKLAYISSGQLGKGEVVVISLADGAVRNLGSKDIPSLNDGEGEWPPLWDSAGENLYGKATDDKLWRIELTSGKGAVAGEIPGFKITGIVTRNERRSLWTTDNGHSVWVVARAREGTKAGIFRIDLSTGHSEPVIEDERSYSTIFNLDASNTTASIAYVAKDQQHLADAWILDTVNRKTHQVSHLNREMERYQLGSARVIAWNGMDGQKLRGALLLPHGYQVGRRLPLIVWIYGGSYGSRYANDFGFWGSYPQFNMHILVTRGYAVLFPDAPLGEGTPMSDLVKTVIPGVDAAIEQGYADPERIAVMGQSYGSYCTLALISQTTRFKAAVITAADLHPDLVADYLHLGTGYYEQGQGNMHGTIWDHRDRYLANSPIFNFDRIETPLLIGQGSGDGDLIPSDAIFEGLKRLNKEVEYRIYENEGHVLSSKPDVLDFWKRRVDFLAEHLRLVLDSNGGIVFDGDRAKFPSQ